MSGTVRISLLEHRNIKNRIRRDMTFSRNFAAVQIRPSGGRRGAGVFAIDSFPSRHKIIVERPIMSCVYRTQPPYESTAAEEWNSYGDFHRATLAKGFYQLRDVPAGDKFKPEHQSSLRRFVDEYGFADPMRERALIYALASHINHACTSCANAEQWVDSAHPHSISVRLMRPIAKDEEIFINYNRRNLKFKCAVCGPKSFRECLGTLWKQIRAKVMGNRDNAASSSNTSARSRRAEQLPRA